MVGWVCFLFDLLYCLFVVCLFVCLTFLVKIILLWQIWRHVEVQSDCINCELRRYVITRSKTTNNSCTLNTHRPCVEWEFLILPIALLRGREKAFSSWNKRKNSCRNNLDRVRENVQIQKQRMEYLQIIIVNAEVSGVGSVFLYERGKTTRARLHILGGVLLTLLWRKTETGIR